MFPTLTMQLTLMGRQQTLLNDEINLAHVASKTIIGR